MESIQDLPDEMVSYVLSFVDADSLLQCRLVCQSWRLFIDTYAFQEKASRENEYVNDGLGYHSFCKVDSSTVRKLDLPWYVFYAICKYDPFHRNLIKNHCGQDGFMYWNIPSLENLWTIEPTPEGTTSPLPDDQDLMGHTSCFVSTYRLCSKTQIINLKNYGLTEKVMSFLKPSISVSEWHAGRFDCGYKYELKIKLYNSNWEILEQHNYQDHLPQWEADVWTKCGHEFVDKNVLSKASFCSIYHSGIDTQYWVGHYGAKITGTVLKVSLPIQLKHAE